MNSFQLSRLSLPLKTLVFTWVFVVSIGLLVGMFYLYQSHGSSMETAQTHFLGDPPSSDPDFIPEHAPMELKQLLSLSHSHILGMSTFFGIIGLLTLGTSLAPKWKTFLAIEPLWSVLLTFGGMFLMRFVHPEFLWLIICSAILMYSTYFLSVFFIYRELWRKTL